MALFSRVIGGFRALFRRTRQEQELDAELVQFLESSLREDPSGTEPRRSPSGCTTGIG